MLTNPQILQIIFFVLLNIALLINGLLVSFRFFPSTRTSLSTLAAYTFFFYISQIIGFQILLGMLGLLSIAPLIIIIFSATIFTFIKFFPYFWKNYKSEVITFKPLGFILFSFLIVFGIVEFFNAGLQPVWEYDSIAYHLPFVRFWLSEGSIWHVLFSVFRGPLGYYPGTGEIYTLWFVLPLGTDFFANIQNFFIFLFTGVVMYDLAKKIGISSEVALFFPAIFLYIPIVIKQLGTPQNDIFFAMAFIYLIYFIIEYIKTKELSYFIPVALSFGLFAGSKYLGVPFSVIPFIIFLIPVILYFRKNKISSFLIYFSISIFCFILTGGFWYIRNFYLTGNPLYPTEFSIGGKTIFQGYSDYSQTIFQWSLINNIFTWTDVQDFFQKYIFRAGYQLYILIAAYFINIFYLFYQAVKKKINIENIIIPLAFFIALPVFFYIYFIAPYTHYHLDANIRYSIVFLVTGSLLITYMIEKIKLLRPFFYIAIFAAIIFTIIYQIFDNNPLQQPFNLALINQNTGLFILQLFIISICFYMFFLTVTLKKYQKIGLLACFALIPMLLISNVSGFQDIRDAQKYNILHIKYPNYSSLVDAYEWFEKSTSIQDNIAYTGFHFEYPLYAKNLNRTVEYIHVNSCTVCDYFQYGKENNTIHVNADKNVWLKNLQDASIDYLIFFDQYGYLKYENKWVEEESSRFITKFDKDGVKIYQFIP